MLRTLPQADHADLGLVEDDHTEDLRADENAPGRCWNTAEGESHTHQMNERGKFMMPESAVKVCRHCAVPTDGADECSFCQSYTPPAAYDVRPIIVGADRNAQMAVEDCQDALGELPAAVPLTVAIDLVAAIAHIKAARRLLDRATTQLDTVQAVTQ